MHKESHQFIELPDVLRPITKWNARVTAPEIIPEVVRKAFKVAETEKPGPTHLELPEDVMAMDLDAEPLPRRRLVKPEPAARELLKAADLIRNAINPVVLAGNGAVRAGAAPALREFSRATGISVAETFMGKGLIDYTDPRALGTVGLQSRDYAMAGFEDADVVITIGYDLVEHAPKHWNPRRDKKIVVIDSEPAEIDEYYTPEVELIGDIYHVHHAPGRGVPRRPAQRRVAPAARRRDRALRVRQGRRPLPDAAAPRAVGDPPGAGPRGHPHLATWGSTSCGSAGCSRPMSRTR